MSITNWQLFRTIDPLSNMPYEMQKQQALQNPQYFRKEIARATTMLRSSARELPYLRSLNTSILCPNANQCNRYSCPHLHSLVSQYALYTALFGEAHYKYEPCMGNNRGECPHGKELCRFLHPGDLEWRRDEKVYRIFGNQRQLIAPPTASRITAPYQSVVHYPFSQVVVIMPMMPAATLMQQAPPPHRAIYRPQIVAIGPFVPSKPWDYTQDDWNDWQKRR